MLNKIRFISVLYINFMLNCINQTKPEHNSCAICCLAKNREFTPVEIMPGGSMKIMRETPTSAIVRFKAGKRGAGAPPHVWS